MTNHKYSGGGLKNSYLKISCPTKDESGEYACTVSNAVGSVSRVVILGKCLRNKPFLYPVQFESLT